MRRTLAIPRRLVGFSLLIAFGLAAVGLGGSGLAPARTLAQAGPQPPTDQPGWVWVAGKTEIVFPDGATARLPDQTGLPERDRVVWARHEYGPVTNTPVTTGAGPLTWEQRYLETFAWTEWCNDWHWCVEIRDSSGVWYYRDTGNGSVFVYTCQAKTHREWNNPYKYPQYSYKKVISFERSLHGGYAPYGTAADNTWYGIGSCSSTQWWPNSTWVRYGSSWDTMPGWPAETSQYNSIYY